MKSAFQQGAQGVCLRTLTRSKACVQWMDVRETPSRARLMAAAISAARTNCCASWQARAQWPLRNLSAIGNGKTIFGLKRDGVNSRF